MNVVSLVSYPFLPARTGGQKGIALFYKYFSRYQQVTCICTQKNDPSLADGYTIKNILSNSRFRYLNPIYFFHIRRIIREKKASHLIIEHPYYGWLGVWLRKSCGVKLVVHSHNIEGNRWKSMGKWWWPILWHYEKFTHRQADYNFFITDADREYAIRNFDLRNERCITVSFGTEISAPPSARERADAKNTLRTRYGIPEGLPLLFFNGAFKYGPNRRALEDLLYRVNPLLQNKKIGYLLLICGIDIPEKYFSELFPAVRVVGFAEDLELYLKGTDLFLNPVIVGGGIKTKLVEALGYNLNVVSTQSGAMGIDPLLCPGKLAICKDGDWEGFARSIIDMTSARANIAEAFFQHFYWAAITRRAAEFIEG